MKILQGMVGGGGVRSKMPERVKGGNTGGGGGGGRGGGGESQQTANLEEQQVFSTRTNQKVRK